MMETPSLSSRKQRRQSVHLPAGLENVTVGGGGGVDIDSIDLSGLRLEDIEGLEDLDLDALGDDIQLGANFSAGWNF